MGGMSPNTLFSNKANCQQSPGLQLLRFDASQPRQNLGLQNRASRNAFPAADYCFCCLQNQGQGQGQMQGQNQGQGQGQMQGQNQGQGQGQMQGQNQGYQGQGQNQGQNQGQSEQQMQTMV